MEDDQHTCVDYSDCSTDMSNSTNETLPLTTYELLGVICCMTIIPVGMLGIIGNIVSIRYFGRKSGSRSTISVLLTALSTFDLILLSTGTPMYSMMGIYTLERHPAVLWILAYCTTVLYPFSNMAQMGSVLTMMVISIERWLGVCHPFLARRQLTVKRCRICIITVAVISVLYNVCRFWEYTVYNDGIPVPLLRNDTTYLNIYVHWMYFIFVFWLPFGVIVIFNFLVAIGIRKAILNRPRCQLNVQQRRERKTTLMLLVIVGIFLFCNCLSWPINAYETFGYYEGDNEETLDFLSDLNNLLVLSHPSLNIFVYLYFSNAFRRKCFSFWSCHKSDVTINYDNSRHAGISMPSCDHYSVVMRKSTANYFLNSSQRRSSSASLMDVDLKSDSRAKSAFGKNLMP